MIPKLLRSVNLLCMFSDMNFLDPKHFLLKEYEERCARNGSYSLRAFARDLGLPSGRLSQYLSGQRRVTKKMADRISNRLSHSPDQRFEFFNAVEFEKCKAKGLPFKGQVKSHRHTLGQNSFDIIANPLHFALLSLMDTEDFSPDLDWIAQRMSVKPQEVQACLLRMEQKGLIRKTKEGWEQTYNSLESTDGVLSPAVQKAHAKVLEEALEVQKKLELEIRDITSMCMTMDTDQMAEAKKMIRDFREMFTQKMESGPKKEVYRLNIQFVPLTKSDTQMIEGEEGEKDN